MRYVEGLTSKEGGYERCGSRTPMQWDASALAGFSTNPDANPYLPIDPQPDRPTVAAQRADRDSLWHHIERLIYLRVTESDLAPDASLAVLSTATTGYPLVYRRGAALIVAINPSLDTHAVALPPLGDAAAVLAHRASRIARRIGLAVAHWRAWLRGVHGPVTGKPRAVRACRRARLQRGTQHCCRWARLRRINTELLSAGTVAADQPCAGHA